MISDIDGLKRDTAAKKETFANEWATFQEKWPKGHPIFTLEWSQSLFTSAARDFVYREVEQLVEADFSLKEIKAWLVDNVLTKARHMSRSTMPTGNLMDDCLLESYAYLAYKIIINDTI